MSSHRVCAGEGIAMGILHMLAASELSANCLPAIKKHERDRSHWSTR